MNYCHHHEGVLRCPLELNYCSKCGHRYSSDNISPAHMIKVDHSPIPPPIRTPTTFVQHNNHNNFIECSYPNCIFNKPVHENIERRINRNYNNQLGTEWHSTDNVKWSKKPNNLVYEEVKKACWHSRAPTAPVRREVRQQFIQPDPVELKIHRVDSNNAPWPVSKEIFDEHLQIHKNAISLNPKSSLEENRITFPLNNGGQLYINLDKYNRVRSVTTQSIVDEQSP